MCEIKFAFTIFRHGARNPESHLTPDKVDILGEKWNAPGELTQVGMRMHYLLGVRNRERYAKFLSSSYKSNEIYVKSTDYNRTIMSVMSQLQGLYPPGTGPELNEWQKRVAFPPTNDHGYAAEQKKLKNSALPNKMQVFPIHLFDKEKKTNFFFYNPLLCRPILNLFPVNQNKPLIVEFKKNFEAQWGPQVRKAMNIEDKPEYFDDYMHLFGLMDTFISGYTDGRKLQSMVNAGIDLAAFNKTAFEFSYNDILFNWNGDDDQWMAKISMNAIIPDVLTWMDNRIAADAAGEGYNGYKTPKFVMFSAHDVTLGSAQIFIDKALNIENAYYTPYASSLFFELYSPEGTETEYTVKVIYNDMELKSLNYSEFKEKLQASLLTDEQISNFCGWTPAPTSFAFLKKKTSAKVTKRH